MNLDIVIHTNNNYGFSGKYFEEIKDFAGDKKFLFNKGDLYFVFNQNTGEKFFDFLHNFVKVLKSPKYFVNNKEVDFSNIENAIVSEIVSKIKNKPEHQFVISLYIKAQDLHKNKKYVPILVAIFAFVKLDLF